MNQRNLSHNLTKKQKRKEKNLNKKLIYAALISSVCALFFLACISPGTTGKLKSYTYKKYSKRDVNKAITCLYQKYPEYKAPEKYKPLMIHFFSNLNTPESRKFNADTVQFHFYIKTSSGDEVFYWTAFPGLGDDWKGKPSELGLRGYKLNEGKLLLQKDLKKKQIRKDKYIALFETEIYSKINKFLSEEKCK